MWYLVGTLAVILLLLIVIGVRVTGRAFGILIDTRKKVSLSQFQIALWTWILLSGFSAIVIGRLLAGAEDPLAVVWDERLWGLLGISVGSTLASGAVKTVKKSKQPAPPALAALAALPADTTRQGLLVLNQTISNATIWDMFRGEEQPDYTLVDIGKVQMFLFTLVAALAYLGALFRLVSGSSAEDITAMPTLDQGLLFILGISHVGYLGNKWVDKVPRA